MRETNYGQLLGRKWKRFLALVCIVCSSLVGIFLTTVPFAYAASIKTDPLVVIMVDETNQGCTQQVTSKTDSSHVATVTNPCPPGTVLGTRVVRESIAIIQHEAYVTLPSPHASLATLEQTDAALQRLREEKGEQIRAHVAPMACVTGQKQANVTATINSGAIQIHLIVTYDTNDCSNIFLDHTGEKGYNVPDDVYFSDIDFYANDNWTWGGCPVVNNSDWKNLYIDKTEPWGDYYVAGWLNSGDLSECGNRLESFLEDQYSVRLT